MPASDWSMKYTAEARVSKIYCKKGGRENTNIRTQKLICEKYIHIYYKFKYSPQNVPLYE